MYSLAQSAVVLSLLTLLLGYGQPAFSQVGQSQQGKSPQTDTEENLSNTMTSNPSKSAAAMAGMKKKMMKWPAAKDIKFKDNLESNVEPPQKVSELVFTNKDGNEIKLADYIGKKHLILVFTEGFNGMLCPFCTTQTSRLVANYDKFKKLNTEIIVVYPGPEDHLDEFVQAARTDEKKQVDKVPFPIVLDKEFIATDYFNIHSMHAHPSTYLIDKEGSVKFAYVGADKTADRPSVKALLTRLQDLE